MSKRKPNFIDRIASFLPGYSDYIEKKESYNAGVKFKTELTLNLQNKIHEVQRISTLNIEELKQKSICIEDMMNLIDRIKATSYGYSSLFSKQQISKDEFEAIRNYDLEIAEMISEINNSIFLDEISLTCARLETAISNRHIKISKYV